MWLIDTDTLRKIEAGIASGLDLPTVQSEINAFDEDYDSGSPSILSVSGDRADITVSGVMTNRPDMFARIFGGGNAVYSEIRNAIAIADGDKSIKEIHLLIDSPGGSVDGLFDTVAAIEAAETKIIADIGYRAASAAFILAAQADEIVASNKVSSVGSFGVATQMYKDEQVIDITNTESPDKRPDAETEEGRAVVREYLDSLFDIFTESVASGRNTTEKDVVENYGRGKMFVAEKALQLGMIDRIADTPADSSKVPVTQSAKTGGAKLEGLMDLAKLKAEFPELYSAVLEEGAAQERDRVSAHLIMGQESGDMKTAVAAIESGDGMTATIQAKYMSAAARRNDVEAREQESQAAASAAAAAGDQGAGEEAELDFADKVAASMTATKSFVYKGGEA